MSETKRGLYVLFEGLPPTVIDSQVLTHVRMSAETLGIEWTVLACAASDENYQQAQSRVDDAREAAQCDVSVVRAIRPAYPFSVTGNRWMAGRALEKLRPIDFVHARTDYTAAVFGPLSRKFGIPMLWDCRGDGVAEFRARVGELPFPQSLLRDWRVRRLKHDIRAAERTADAAAFVSNELREAVLPDESDLPSWITPCAAPSDRFFFDPLLRSAMRAKLGYTDSDIVLIYAGSLHGYQLFDETVERVRTWMSDQLRIKLLILTGDETQAKLRTASLPNSSVTITKAPFAEVNGYLNAADAGLLLRNPTPVNRGAFPTKFAEYSMAGLQIVMKDDPPICVRYAKGFGNYVCVDRVSVPEGPALGDREKISRKATENLSRQALLVTYQDIYQRLADCRSSKAVSEIEYPTASLRHSSLHL